MTDQAGLSHREIRTSGNVEEMCALDRCEEKTPLGSARSVTSDRETKT